MMPSVKKVMGSIVCSTCENCIGHTCDMYMCDKEKAINVCKTEKHKYYLQKKVKRPIGINFKYAK